MHQYLVIRNIAVQTANARPLWWVVAAAPVVAAVQFAHALGRAAGALPTGIHLVHHDAQHLGERGFDYGRYAPQQRRGAMLINEDDFSSRKKPANILYKSLKPLGALSLQPTATAHLSLSIVMEFEAAVFSGWKNHNATQFLDGARFAGGQIITYDEEPQRHDSLESALRQIGRGFLVIDRTDLLRNRPDPMDALVEALYREQERGKQPWLCPTNLGYILANKPRARHGSRQGLPHAWAEPLAGLVEFMSLRTTLSQKKTIAPWSAHWLNEFTWVVQQKELNNEYS